MNRALKIGLTGGVGSGKTTATKFFSELGVPVIDADEISRNLTRRGGAAYDAVASLFGPEVVGNDGELRRDLIRQKVFSNDGLRRDLEGIIHPLVRAEIDRRAAEIDYPYCIISVPLLIETGMKQSVDRVLIIDLPEEQQINRAALRDRKTAGDIHTVAAAQAARADRLQAADDVIDNASDLQHLQTEVQRLHAEYLRLAHDRIASAR
ncbi:MAG: dephospho-CoA kinase [Gammaproteobacteria bacterium]|nr:dephospho-CoA kinase [Gammaproteobacteria bacterium]